LSSITFFDSLEKIKNEYESRGYKIEIETIKNIYYTGINAQEIQRINKLERIDEFEELNIMCDHYFYSIAYYGENSTNKEAISLNTLKE